MCYSPPLQGGGGEEVNVKGVKITKMAKQRIVNNTFLIVCAW